MPLDKFKQQANKIDAAKDNATNLDISGLEGAAYASVIGALESDFNIKKGSIVVEKNFVSQLNTFVNDVFSTLQIEPKFVGAVSEFVKRIPQIGEAIGNFQQQNSIDLGDVSVAGKIVSDYFRDSMLHEGLNANFIQPLRDLIYRDALSGLTIGDAKSLIGDYIKSGKDQSGKLKSYVQQTAQQGVDAYSGLISMKLLQRFNYDAQLMSGSLIDTSSPQCRYVVNELGGVITRANWPTVKKIAAGHGLIDGTTFDNLPVNQLHWGCRHSFYPMILKKAA